MRRALPLVALLLAGPLQAQTPSMIDAARDYLTRAKTEGVRGRGFSRANDTEWTKTMALIDSALVLVDSLQLKLAACDTLPAEPADTVTLPPVDTVAPPDTIPVPTASILPPGAEFITGPQVPIGESPWPAYDSILVAQGPVHHAHYMAQGNSETWYYDHGLIQYIRAERMRDTAALRLAHEVTAKRWEQVQGFGNPTGFAPRSAGIGSLMIWALEGHGDDPGVFGADTVTVWRMLELYVRHHINSWVLSRMDKETLHYGLRDGGYALLYTAQLAAVHPDPTVRAELQELALRAARDYYVPRQYPDGGWYWGDSQAAIRIMKPDSTYWRHSQPFMVGLLLDGMVATHQLTGDTVVARSIVRAADWMHRIARVDTVQYTDSTFAPSLQANYGTVLWRGNWYFVWEPGTLPPPDGSAWYDRGYVVQGRTGITWDVNGIRNVRQMVPEGLHVFGYAYELTGDTKYVDWGDEQFAASFGKGQGPLADPFYCLNDYIAKNYNQAYRSSGPYLARRRQ
jgi:hypothetical protein